MRSPDRKLALPFKWIADARPIAAEWRVRGMIPKKGIGLLIGWRGSGKTWIALTLSLMIASARQFAERKSERCGVLRSGQTGSSDPPNAIPDVPLQDQRSGSDHMP